MIGSGSIPLGSDFNQHVHLTVGWVKGKFEMGKGLLVWPSEDFHYWLKLHFC
jgi:hypothetical protein